MREHQRVLTIVEGRSLNQNMAQEVVKAALAMGWGARLVKNISALDVADNKIDEIFSDYVLWRGPETGTVYEAERLVTLLNASGRVTINTHAVGGLSCTSHKFFQHGVWACDPELREYILPAYLANKRSEILGLVKAGKVQYPFCVKPCFGTRGEGIVLVREEKDLDKVRNFDAVMVEPYVKSTYDWRVFVLDGKALGVMRKMGNTKDEADFVAKSAGWQRVGESDPEVIRQVEKIAVGVAKVSGLDYTGVDLIRDDKSGKFYVLETNFAGGWQNGFLQATGVSVPEEIVKYFEKKYQEREKGLTK